MKHVFVRPARKEDVEKIIEWSLNTKNNLFDPDTVGYPSALTVAAFNKDKVILFAPSQRPFFLEALAVNPEAEELEVAAALKEITQFYVSQAYIQGISEIYMPCADEATAEFAKRQQYEEMPFRLFRIKVTKLEPGE